jgi:hypothetical protein
MRAANLALVLACTLAVCSFDRGVYGRTLLDNCGLSLTGCVPVPDNTYTTTVTTPTTNPQTGTALS